MSKLEDEIYEHGNWGSRLSGQREHRYERIVGQIKEKEMKVEVIDWFTKFFKYDVRLLR